MESGTRACIAYIIGKQNNQIASSVYDYSQSKHISVSGTVTSDAANIYDYDRNCNISGSLESLYDFGTNSHIQLKINGNQFNGYDYASSHHYNGSVNGNSIIIYDYETSQHYIYSV